MDRTTATMTVPALARALGVSLPTAHRALDTVGVPRTGRGHPRVVSVQVAQELLDARGRTPHSDHESSELRILAALSRSPLGQKSLRSIAAKAGVSPSTVSHVVRSLVREGYVQQRETTVASGRARREQRWFADAGGWPEQLRDAVRSTRLPKMQAGRRPLPRELHHLFWNADVSNLDPETNGSYMAERMLRSPDLRAWQWALTNVDRTDVEKALSRRGVDERTRALARNWWADAG